MIIVKPAKDQQQLSPNTITLYKMDVQNDSNQNRKKRILTTSPPSDSQTKEYKFYRHKVKCIKVVKTYMSIVYNGMTYVCDVSVLIFEETADAAVAE